MPIVGRTHHHDYPHNSGEHDGDPFRPSDVWQCGGCDGRFCIEYTTFVGETRYYQWKAYKGKVEAT